MSLRPERGHSFLMPDFTQFIFVDFENVQEIDLGLLREKPVHVTLLIGAKQTKVQTELLFQTHSLGRQVELVRVGASGRNALDLTLAMHLGRQIERHPTALFAIVSRDKDFDPMITHLHAANVNVTRASTFAAVPFLSRPKRMPVAKPAVPTSKPATPAALKPAAPTMKTMTVPAKPTLPPLPTRTPTPAPSALAKRQNALLARLGNPTNKHRPNTQKSLAAHIKTALGNDVSDAEVSATLNLLESRRILSINEQKKVVYAAS